MAPVILRSKILEILLQKCSHCDDTVSHSLDLTKPLLVQGRIVEDLRSNAGAMDRRIGIERSDKNLDLGVDALLLLGIFTDDGEGTDAFAVEALGISAVFCRQDQPSQKAVLS